MTARPEDIRRRWLGYLADRVGTYEYRTLRFAAVYEELLRNGLVRHDLIIDVGAGMCDFGRYAYSTRGFDGRYLPVDGAIDGTDLSEPTFRIPITAEFIISIETVEHFPEPQARYLIEEFIKNATKAVVITTPNPHVYNGEDALLVSHLDPTHRCHFFPEELADLGFTTNTQMLFGRPNDTIVATYVP